jgi:hypothetical protein
MKLRQLQLSLTVIPTALRAQTSETEVPAAATGGGGKANRPEGPGEVRGVSEMDAALILRDGDKELAQLVKARWQKDHKDRPKAIGHDPKHSQVKLYTLDSMTEYVARVDKLTREQASALKGKLASKLRSPENRPQDRPQPPAPRKFSGKNRKASRK